MGRAGKARVEAADGSLNAVEHPFLQPARGNKMARGLLNCAIYSEIILCGRDEQVDLAHEAVVIDLVVVKEHPARRLA